MSLFGENGTLTKTYRYLVRNGILLGSKIENPLLTRNAGQTLNNSYLIDRAVSIPATTETILYSIKNTDQYKKIKFSTFNFVTDGNKSVKFALYLNGVTTGTFNSWDIDSIAEVSTTSTLSITNTTISGINKIEEQIGGLILNKSDRARLDISGKDVNISLNQNDILTVTAYSDNTSLVDCLVRWIEER